MTSLLPYLKIARLNNAVLAGIAVALGFWLGGSTMHQAALVLLVIAAIAATAFGNVVNDIHDVATDRISHPERSLPRNEMSVRNARSFAAWLAFVSLESAIFVSPVHAAATLFPLLLLLSYARFLKGTPLAGNIIVSLLVGYAILYGALLSPHFNRLIIPAVLAFLLNVVREIVKDIQDAPGDRAAGIVTTAILSHTAIKSIIYSINTLYLLLLFVPSLLGHFGTTYALIAAIGIVPLQITWILIFVNNHWQSRLPLLSMLLKIEMALGLAALAMDQLLK